MNNNIGKIIASKRKEKKLTQQELGNRLFITDKAISKWERGLSLPDITMLKKLANELDTDIYEILQIESKNKIDVSEVLKQERKKIRKQLLKKNICILLPITLIIIIILFKLLPFGYIIKPIHYTNNNTNKVISLGVPKFSFNMKNNENSYSYKNFRGNSVLISEVRNYLNSLEHISCNNTTYFFDKDAVITIIDYKVKNRFLYNTISYNIRMGNYCNTMLLKEYKEKLGTLNTFRTLYSENKQLVVHFLPEIKKNQKDYLFEASMNIYYNSKVLEVSKGTFKIENDELIYYRTEISNKDKDINIPNVSVFVIKNNKLILKENYLSKYEKGIILK